MSGANTTLNCISETSTLVRPRFGPGMLLHHDDLEQLSAYTRELSRLLFRSLFGCGVVCGLVVKTKTDCGKVYVTVGAGLALDCSGDPVYVPKNQRLAIDEECDPNLKPPLYVVLCGTVKCCSPRTPVCPSDEEETPSTCTRERDGFEIKVMSRPPKCACGCPEQEKKYESRRGKETKCQCADPEDPCYADHYDGKCGCTCEDGSGPDCSCECILLARLDKTDDEKNPWRAEHSVRRFVRPVLMSDPQVALEQKEREEQQQEHELALEVLDVQAKESGPFAPAVEDLVGKRVKRKPRRP